MTGGDIKSSHPEYQLEQLGASGGSTDGHAEIHINWGSNAGASSVGVNIYLQLPGGAFMKAYVDGNGFVRIEHWTDDLTMFSSTTSDPFTNLDASGGISLAANFETSTMVTRCSSMGRPVHKQQHSAVLHRTH